MADLVLYGLKNCDTCKKALNALEGSGKAVAFIDIRADADLAAKVPAWLDAVGPDVLVNRRSTTWRGLDDAARADAEGGKAAAVLVDNPTLIKRPVIEDGDAIQVGWTKAVQGAFGV